MERTLLLLLCAIALCAGKAFRAPGHAGVIGLERRPAPDPLWHAHSRSEAAGWC